MGAISYGRKISSEIFEDNLNTNWYIQILSSKLDEIKMIINCNKILLRIDNCRVHWSLDSLRFYWDNNIKYYTGLLILLT